MADRVFRDRGDAGQVLAGLLDGYRDRLGATAPPVERGVPADETPFDLVGDASYVLIGEASHGTHDFYAARAVEPLGRAADRERGEAPETYPFTV